MVDAGRFIVNTNVLTDGAAGLWREALNTSEVGEVVTWPFAAGVMRVRRRRRRVDSSGTTATGSPSSVKSKAWTEDGTIIFGTQRAGLFSVADGGGDPVALTAPEGDERHLWPEAVPGTDAVLFVIHDGVTTPKARGQLAVLDRKTGRISQLNVSGVSPHYVSSGHIVYATADDAIVAVPFDIGHIAHAPAVGSPSSLAA